MKFTYSLRFKLSILYIIIIVIPVLIISIAMPYYYQSILSKETEKLTESTLSSVSNNINTYLEDLAQLTIVPYLNEDILFAIKAVASHQYETAPPYTQLSVNRALYEVFPKYLKFSREEIISTSIITLDGIAFSHSRNGELPVPDYPFQDQIWYQKIAKNDGKITFIPTHPQDYITREATPHVFSVARLIKDPETQRPLAMMLADADTRTFQKILDNVDLNNDRSFITIMDEERNVFFSNKPIPESLRNQLTTTNTVVGEDGDKYVVVSKKIQPANWELVVLLSKSEITAKVQWIFIIGVLFAFFCCFLTLLLFFVLSRWIIRPFREMVDVMRQVEHGNFQVRVLTEGEDEIAMLAHSFNSMVSQISELINREYRAVLNQRNAEYRALQSQIQPHFLYNTLNGFIGLNRIGEKKTLEKAILALSSMLRYTLQKVDWSTVSEEFMFLQKYCQLQGLRFQERMEIRFHMDEAVADWKIPRLLLQPLVENAIIHGIEPAEEPCYIEITATQQFDNSKRILVLAITDNGIGFEVTKNIKNKSIGLSNVKERLELAYPTALFHIKSQPGQGTHIQICIPEEEFE